MMVLLRMAANLVLVAGPQRIGIRCSQSGLVRATEGSGRGLAGQGTAQRSHDFAPSFIEVPDSKFY